MKRFFVLLFLSYVSSDKLDLTYLPPPGSQYAGGRPEDIQTPLEYPKQSYSTTQRPSTVTFGQKVPSPDDYEATIGIDRVPPLQNQGSFPPQGSKAALNNYQNTNNVPSTTVSYAFTQTTTHPPTDSFETTIIPINPITGLSTNAPFNVPSQVADQIYRGNNNQFQPSTPGYQKYNTVTGQTTPGLISQFPGSSLPSLNQFNGDQNRPGQTQFQQGFQQSDFGRRPGFNSEGPLRQTQFLRNQTLIRGNNRQPGFIPSTNAPQSPTSGYFPSITTDRNTDNVQGFTTAIPDQAGIYNKIPNAYQPDSKIGSQNNYPTLDNKAAQQKYPGYSSSTAQPYQPTSTVTPTISVPRFGSQQSASGDYSYPVDIQGNYQPTNQGSFDTNSGNYPSSVNFDDTNRGRFNTNVYVKRPERPQAEADRNAVILNYKNVITPEGFEYSFDTSNGIHVDENGTAIDGVKAEGSYSYTGDDGKVYTVVYTADENGFRPHGDHLPTPPPIPEAIQRVIEKANQDKEAGIFDDGSYDEGKYGYKKFQGIGGRYPQDSDKFTSGDKRPSEQDGYYSPSRQQSQKNKFLASQPGLKKTSSDFDDFSESQEQYEDDHLGEDDIRPNNKKMFLRPENRISNKGTADQYSIKPISDIEIPKRPVTNAERIQNHEEVYYNNDQNIRDNKRPSSTQRPSSAQYPIEKNDDEYFDELSIDDERNSENIPGENSLHKGGLRRPQAQQKQRLMETDRIRTPGSSLNQNRDESNRQQFIGKPVSGISQDKVQTIGVLENGRRPVNRLPSRRPTEQSATDEYDIENTDIYNPNEDRTDIRNKPNRLPSKYPAETTELTTIEDYTTSSEVPSRFKPSRINKTVVNMKTQQIVSKNRRPSRPGLIEHNVNPDNQESIDNVLNEYVTEDDDGAYTDSYTTPATKDRFEVSQGLNPHINQQYVTKRPQSFSTKYSSPRDRLQGTQTEYQNERNGEQINDNVKYGQRLRGKPTVSPSANIGNIRESNNKVVNSTGYQYIPPRNRFNFDEGNNHSTKYPATGYSTTRKPYQQLTQYDSKDTTAKPFMTPNVSRVYSESPEQYDENIRINNEKLPNQQSYDEKQKFENNEQDTTPDQMFSNEVISTGRHSVQSTLRPIPQTTTKPQYNQQYSTSPGYKTTPEGTIPLFQDKYVGKDSNIRRPYETSSTTPVTSGIRRPYETSSATPVTSGRPSYYGTTPNEIVIPGQKNIYSEATQNQMRPINKFVSPTTPSPSQSPSYSESQGSVFDGSYPNGNIENQYQTTYQPNRPTTPSYDRITGQPSTEATGIVQSGPKATQNIYGNQPPSTTYRPNYTIKGTEGSRRPILQLDNFGRPIVSSEGQDFQQQYYQNPDGSSPLDNQNTSYQYTGKEQNYPGSGQHQRIPGYQTSTERVIGEDFSGPKQQQRFDPKLGYYY